MCRWPTRPPPCALGIPPAYAGQVWRSFPADRLTPSPGRRVKHEPTQYSPNNAWNQNFDDGNQNNDHKDNQYRARAVRRFNRRGPCRKPFPQEHPLNELALFTGAGGGLLGGHLLGWRTICAVERDAYAAQVLAQRQNDGCLPAFPIWSDVCSFDGRPWRGLVDVVSGGFPCQDISAAGGGYGH
ncbi:DNA cytosine methyltransferase [Pseudogulbenkiania sp. NH8B]|uniref:DNA cytosine methyltransferase n=1 Tax=Pseudogulbenkiania sp. (strain NH8B) TaxID=748280 RepID=UPI00350F8395